MSAAAETWVVIGEGVPGQEVSAVGKEAGCAVIVVEVEGWRIVM